MASTSPNPSQTSTGLVVDRLLGEILLSRLVNIQAMDHFRIMMKVLRIGGNLCRLDEVKNEICFQTDLILCDRPTHV
ncbi:MAG: hypothetical protein D6742_01415 [Cyanobacteria bacterium J069]|nr:MAG: hypothetical protein D6742_01415 [Cyanobacteria bacterium J069]